MSGPVVGSLFTGYGGLEMAVRDVFLGAELAWVCEHEPATTKNPRPSQAAARLLARRHPDVPNLGDISRIDWRTIRHVDIVTGGFPCQDVSHAGRQAGLGEGTRTGLWSRMLDAVRELRPALVVAENVRGLLSAPSESESNAFECVCGGPVGRGGLAGPSDHEGLLPGQNHGRDDAPSSTDALRPVGTMGRIGGHDAVCNGPVGRGVGVDRGGIGGIRAAGRSDTVPAHQDPAGGSVARGGETKEGTAPPSEWQCGVDYARSHAVRTDQGGDTPVESEGSATCPTCGGVDREALREMESCPWCLGGSADSEPLMRALGRVLADLADVGYDAAWVGVRAADVGAPHGRFRVFILAWPAADADSLGPIRGRGARGRRPGLADVRVGLADTDGAGREGGWPAGPDRRGDAARRTAADAPGDGWHEGRPESARLVGGPDAPLGRAGATADAYRDGLASVGRLDALECDADGRGGSDAAWGDYEPAIRRWERVLGRPAPSPTEPGAKGAPRLSPAFVEWMMGLPEGWVTACPGISRNDQLKMLGNGVVPQQGAAALRLLLGHVGGAA